jgi:hypothetical protein
MKKLLLSAFLVLCASAVGEVPSTVAIRNAKIVTVSGPVIAKGTVIVRGGLIDAVGENVPIPADAWVVDGEGMTVYPGLIDGLSTVGIAGAAPAAAAAGGGRAGRGTTATPATTAAPAAPSERSWGPEDRPQTTSWLLAADEISAGDRRVETVRGAGITTAVTFPTRGIFGGQGSIIDLVSGEKAAEMVLVPAAGQYIALGRAGGYGGGGGGGGGFPSSLMGIISYIRQIYLDADHYRLAKEAYAKDPRGMERPQYDRALEGVLASKRILLPANRVVEIDRMLRFGAELKQPMILYGARDAYDPQAVDLLKKANATVLLSLKWPTAPARSADAEDSDTLRVLEERDKAATAPAALQRAGVKFALYSDGVDAPRDFQRAVKKAIDNGLSREDALRALTLSPAEIYGVADRVGSIEKGKIANLVLTKGDIFENSTTVVMVFVDGKKYTPAETAAPGGRGGAATDDPGPGGNR